VVAFAAKLPARLKMKVLNQKYLLKKAFAGMIPDSITGRPKQPYRAPDGKSFFAAGAPEYARELLSPQSLEQQGIFDPKAVTTLAKKFQAGRASSVKDNMAMVGVLSSELLMKQFINHKQRILT
jgi:asparagine synthase (glutamine-hydrolysing)